MAHELEACGAIALNDFAPGSWLSRHSLENSARWRARDELTSIPDLLPQLLAHARWLAAHGGHLDEAYTLWRELAIAEAVGYLSAELADHRFDESWALQSVPAMDRGLRRLSCSKLFYFCWLSVRELASRYLRYPASVHTLADSLVTYLDQRIDRALVERWTIRDWSNPASRRPSHVSRIFSDEVTMLGARYLAVIPLRSELLI